MSDPKGIEDTAAEHRRLSGLAIHAALNLWFASETRAELDRVVASKALLHPDARHVLDEVEGFEGVTDFVSFAGLVAIHGSQPLRELVDVASTDPIATFPMAELLRKLTEGRERTEASRDSLTLRTLADAVVQGELVSREALYAAIDELKGASYAKHPPPTLLPGPGSEPAKPPTFPIYTVGDRVKERQIELPMPLIEGALFPGLTVMYGRWKRSKKTLYALAQAFCLQAGVPFLGRELDQKRVMFIQRDMPEGQFIEYARYIQEGLALPAAEIRYVSEAMDLNQAEDREKLLATLRQEAEKPDVLYIDSSRGVTRIDEDDAGEVSEFVRGYLINQIRDVLGINIVLVAHPGKNSQSVRGSGDWEASADSIQSFKPNIPTGEEHSTFTRVDGFGRHEDFSLNFAIDHFHEQGRGWILRELEGGEQEIKSKVESPIARFERMAPLIEGWYSSTQWGEKCKIRTKDRPDMVLKLHARGLMQSNREPHPLTKWRWIGPKPQTTTTTSDSFPRQLPLLPPLEGGERCREASFRSFPEAREAWEAPEGVPEQPANEARTEKPTFGTKDF